MQRIWAAHGLQPHRVRTFKLSTDPAFAAKLRDVVGLYVDPPAHAVVLSVDEKSQIQALDRTQPGLPMKKGRAGTMTHDYKRNGTTTLFAALNLLDGSVIGQCMQRHRHQEFIRFLNRIERDVPAGKLIHVVLDNYATHKHPKVRAWLERHEPLDLPLHPDLGIMAECRRGLLRQAHPAAPPARRVPLARRPAGRDQPLPRRAQPGTQAVRLDRRARRDPGQGQTRASNVRDDPLAPARRSGWRPPPGRVHPPAACRAAGGPAVQVQAICGMPAAVMQHRLEAQPRRVSRVAIASATVERRTSTRAPAATAVATSAQARSAARPVDADRASRPVPGNVHRHTVAPEAGPGQRFRLRQGQHRPAQQAAADGLGQGGAERAAWPHMLLPQALHDLAGVGVVGMDLVDDQRLAGRASMAQGMVPRRDHAQQVLVGRADAHRLPQGDPRIATQTRNGQPGRSQGAGSPWHAAPRRWPVLARRSQGRRCPGSRPRATPPRSCPIPWGPR